VASLFSRIEALCARIDDRVESMRDPPLPVVQRVGEIVGFGPPCLLRDCDGRHRVSSAVVLLKVASVAHDAFVSPI
jgi:hypothetical protein